MSDSSFQLNHQQSLLVLRKDAVDSLLSAADAECVLLYLYLVCNDGVADLSGAAARLNRTEADIRAAATRLATLGIIENAPAIPARREPESRKGVSAQTPKQSIPGAENTVRRDAFRELLDEVQTLQGQLLSTPELQILCSVYDNLRLPAEALVLLAQYCKEDAERKKGPGAKFSFKMFERLAFAWDGDGVNSYEKAEKWIADTTERKEKLSEVLKAIGFADVNPSVTQRNYIDAWLKLGYGPDEIALAADRTVIKLGQLKFQYTDAIIRKWNEKNLRTLREIEAEDLPPHKQKPAQVSNEDAGATRQVLEDMRRLREALRRE